MAVLAKVPGLFLQASQALATVQEHVRATDTSTAATTTLALCSSKTATRLMSNHDAELLYLFITTPQIMRGVAVDISFGLLTEPIATRPHSD